MRNAFHWMPLLILGLMLTGCERRIPASAASRPRTATLTWDASAPPVSGYKVYRSADPYSEPALLATTDPGVTQYVDTAVEPGRTYYYSVKAVSPSGVESDSSETISSTIPAE